MTSGKDAVKVAANLVTGWVELVISIRQASRFLRQDEITQATLTSVIDSSNNSTPNYSKLIQLSQTGLRRASARVTSAVPQLKIKQQPRLLLHIGMLAGIIAIVVIGSLNAKEGTSAPVASQVASPLTKIGPTQGHGGVVDETASAYIAAGVATQVNLAVAQDVTKHAQALSAQIGQTQVSDADSYLQKPQVITTAGDSREITHYEVAKGDTVASIAHKFNLSSDTIRWANDIAEGEQPTVGQNLTILPVNGILHTVDEHDTAEGLATLYHTDAQLIISFNDAELAGLKPGSKIVIPGGTNTTVPAPVAQTLPASSAFVPVYSGAIKYSFGWCTYGAAVLRAAAGHPIADNWGDAISWFYNAKLSGYRVGYTPRVGAVAWEGRIGINHVAYVDAVSRDGKMIKYTDMNGLAGWGAFGHSGWVTASDWGYIY